MMIRLYVNSCTFSWLICLKLNTILGVHAIKAINNILCILPVYWWQVITFVLLTYLFLCIFKYFLVTYIWFYTVLSAYWRHICFLAFLSACFWLLVNISKFHLPTDEDFYCLQMTFISIYFHIISSDIFVSMHINFNNLLVTYMILYIFTYLMATFNKYIVTYLLLQIFIY